MRFQIKLLGAMDSKNYIKMIIISLFIAVFLVIFFCEIESLIPSLFFKEKYILMMGILSAPENAQKRQSLRNTWLKLTSDLSVKYYFGVGEHICSIHPMDRISPHSCTDNWFSFPKNISSETEFSTLRQKNINQHVDKLTSFFSSDSIGFGFETLRTITIRKLGVVKGVLEHFRGDVKVKLVSMHSRETLASVTLGYESTVSDDSDFLLKSIRPMVLKRGFEAQIVMELVHGTMNILPSCEDVEWNDSPGVINYLQLLQLGSKKPWSFNRNSCSHVLMNYTLSVEDLNDLKAFIEGKEQRRIEWQNTRKNILLQLKSESATYGDIAFLSVVDVYQNLPRKVIRFFRKLMDTENFHYFLKVDDDSFVDVLRVYWQLLLANQDEDAKEITTLCEISSRAYTSTIRSLNFWWWSSFRESWKVQETGKWRDDKYRSAVYPPFPCGGGYILNRRIIAYLSENWKNFQYFQGEDVSIGIWLAGLNKIRFKTASVVPRSEYYCIQKKILIDYKGGEALPAFFNFSNLNKNNLVSDFCEWTCENFRHGNIPLCNKVQLSEAEMYRTWNEYIHNGFIQ